MKIQTLYYNIFRNSFITLLILCFCGIFGSTVIVSPAAANSPEGVTFTWQKNPPQDYVIGYRLYYGGYSRFDSSGNTKANFNYEYYIDLNELQRCTASNSGTICENLAYDDLQCDMYSTNPKCTVFNLSGKQFFAMTAYDAQQESEFTRELKIDLPNRTNGMDGLDVSGLLIAINLLLLK